MRLSIRKRNLEIQETLTKHQRKYIEIIFNEIYVKFLIYYPNFIPFL
jgi:hypothetical protein